MESFIKKQKVLIENMNEKNIENSYKLISDDINNVLENTMKRLEKIDNNLSFIFFDTFFNIQDDNDFKTIEDIKKYYNDILNNLISKYSSDLDLIS